MSVLKSLSPAFCVLCFISLTVFANAESGKVISWGTQIIGEDLVGDYKAVSAGASFSVGLKKDGSIAVWGSNVDNDDVFIGLCNVPVPNSDFQAVAAGAYHILALKTDGSVVAWGKNNLGQCNIPSPNSDFIAVAAGLYHSIGLKSDNTLVAWGSGPAIILPVPNADFVEISCGWNHTLARKSDGSIVAFGRETEGQCFVPSPNSDFIAVSAAANWSMGLKSDHSIVAWGGNLSQRTIPTPNTDFTTIDAGDDRGLAIKSDGSIVWWGTKSFSMGAIPEPNEDFVGISGGNQHYLALKSDGTVIAWGLNQKGECEIAPNTDFIKVDASRFHTVALRADGSVGAWGKWTESQISVPAPNQDFIDVAAGDYHSLGVKRDGTVVCWGLNSQQQCTVPSPNADFQKVAAGGYHSLGLKDNNSVVCWGENGSFQCDVPAPNSDFVAVAAGYLHSLGLKSNGSIVAWGSNGSGERNVPLPNSGYKAIAAGGLHSLGLRDDGSIEAWGSNSFGQIEVPLPNSGFVAIGAGAYTSFGIKSDGSIMSWGRNTENQITLPSLNSRFIAVDGGSTFSVAIRNKIIYVDENASGGADNGSSWPNAYLNLQDALAAAHDYEQIWVAEGIYEPDKGVGLTPDDRNLSFGLKNAVALYGGFPAGGGIWESRDPEAAQTVLSGNIGYFEDETDNSIHVFYNVDVHSSAVLDGFYIAEGYNTGTSGGGIYNLRSNPAIRNCVFIDNSAANGGALYNLHSKPVVTDCDFLYNSAPGNAGGAVYNNTSPATFLRCRFTGNSTLWAGGGMYNHSGSNVLVKNCIFNSNFSTSTGLGGGAVHHSTAGELRTYAVYENCTFYGNHSAANGGVSYSRGGSNPTFINCILWNNTDSGPQDYSAQIYNASATSTETRYSCIQGWTPALGGIGNIALDPLFIDASNGDYHLKSAGWRWNTATSSWWFDSITSRCVDAGCPGYSLADEPMAIPGDPYNVYSINKRIEMGAYGGTSEASMPPHNWALASDVDNDGLCSLTDFSFFVDDWLGELPHSHCDFTRDNQIDFSDYSVLAGEFLEQTSWH